MLFRAILKLATFPSYIKRAIVDPDNTEINCDALLRNLKQI